MGDSHRRRKRNSESAAFSDMDNVNRENLGRRESDRQRNNDRRRSDGNTRRRSVERRRGEPDRREHKSSRRATVMGAEPVEGSRDRVHRREASSSKGYNDWGDDSVERLHGRDSRREQSSSSKKESSWEKDQADRGPTYSKTRDSRDESHSSSHKNSSSHQHRPEHPRVPSSTLERPSDPDPSYEHTSASRAPCTRAEEEKSTEVTGSKTTDRDTAAPALSTSDVANSNNLPTPLAPHLQPTEQTLEFAIIICANLAHVTDEIALRDNFRRYEGLQSIYFARNEHISGGRYAVLEYSSFDGAHTAMNKQGWNVFGHPLRLQLYMKPYSQSPNSESSTTQMKNSLLSRIVKTMTNQEAASTWIGRLCGIAELNSLFKYQDMSSQNANFYDKHLFLASEFPKDEPIQSIARKYSITFKNLFRMIDEIEEHRGIFKHHTELIYQEGNSSLKNLKRSSICLSILGLDECFKNLDHFDTVFQKLLGPNRQSEGIIVYEVRNFRNDTAHSLNGFTAECADTAGIFGMIHEGLGRVEAEVEQMKKDSDRRIEDLRIGFRASRISKDDLIGVGIGAWGIGSHGGNADDADEGEIVDSEEL